MTNFLQIIGAARFILFSIKTSHRDALNEYPKQISNFQMKLFFSWHTKYYLNYFQYTLICNFLYKSTLDSSKHTVLSYNPFSIKRYMYAVFLLIQEPAH